jgi:AraC-like DNA-binding protein
MKEFKTLDKSHYESRFPMCSVGEGFTMSEGAVPLQMLDAPHCIDDVRLYVCCTGSAEVSLDKTTHTLRPGGILAVDPEQILETVSVSDDFTAWLVMFSQDFADCMRVEMRLYLPLFYRFRQHRYLQLTTEESDMVVFYMSHILDRMKKVYEPRKKQILLQIVLLALVEISAILDKYFVRYSNLSPRKIITFSHFTELVEKYYTTRHKVQFYADELSMSPRYLSRIVKEIYGRTSGQYIDDYIVFRVKILLCKTSIKLTDISSNLSFSSISTFSRFFTRVSGITPAKYRKNTTDSRRNK